MRFHRIAVVAILCLLVIDTVSGETPKKKKRKRKKQNLKNHIQCFECFRDYSTWIPFFGTDLCYNPNLNPDRAIDEHLVTCPKDSTICQMDIHRLNGYFVALERKCAPACHCICKSTGYGLEREICSKCSKPIDYVEFDNETIPETTCEPSRGSNSERVLASLTVVGHFLFVLSLALLWTLINK